MPISRLRNSLRLKSGFESFQPVPNDARTLDTSSMRLDECQELDSTSTRALREMSGHVNLDTGLGHPSDAEWAVAIFSLMYGKGAYPHPDAVSGFLTSECGWRDELAVVAGHVWETVATLRDFDHQRSPFPVDGDILGE